MQIPKFSVNTFDGIRSDTRNTRLAALILAMEVPLKPENPYSTQAGDGFSGVRVTWNFMESNPAGLKPGKIIQAWIDLKWCADNPDHVIPKVKKAFEEYDRLIACAKGNFSSVPNVGKLPTLKTHDTRQAAGMVALGHPLCGKSISGDVVFWHFNQAAAADLATWDAYADHHKLPDTDLCVIRATMENHKRVVDATKQIQFARVAHKGRTAIIGRDATPDQISQIERILYR